MTARWQWAMRVLTRRIWFRAAIFSLFSVLLALLAAWVAPFVPYEISTKIGSEAVDNVLTILASGLLAVTTFSLTAMVSAFSGASSTITPRATELLVQDSTAQNALSTFLGGFLFSIVGICALSTGYYGQSGRVILFAGTVVMIVIIVATLLRWIEHLSSFGRVADSISRVEKVACRAATEAGFAVRLDARSTGLPDRDRGIAAPEIGYVTHIDLPALRKIAQREECTIHVLAMPGSFVTPAAMLAWQEGGGAPCAGEIAGAFAIDHDRQFDQDPRFGLVVLSEIASRALSPAINDPGTAISVLGAGVRVLDAILRNSREREEDDRCVRLPGLALPDLLDDLFEPIARDGGGMLEVQIKLQRSLAQLGALSPEAARILRRRAARLAERARDRLDDPADRARLDEASGRDA